MRKRKSSQQVVLAQHPVCLASQGPGLYSLGRGESGRRWGCYDAAIYWRKHQATAPAGEAGGSVKRVGEGLCRGQADVSFSHQS